MKPEWILPKHLVFPEVVSSQTEEWMSLKGQALGSAIVLPRREDRGLWKPLFLDVNYKIIWVNNLSGDFRLFY